MGKRVWGAALCVCLLLLLVLACPGRRVRTGEGEGTEGKAGSGDFTRIVMTYQYLEYSNLDHIEEIIAAVNEISRSEIGVEVELKFVEALDSFTDYPVWLSKGERIDLMLLNYQNIRYYVDRDMLLPMGASGGVRSGH